MCTYFEAIHLANLAREGQVQFFVNYLHACSFSFCYCDSRPHLSIIVESLKKDPARRGQPLQRGQFVIIIPRVKEMKPSIMHVVLKQKNWQKSMDSSAYPSALSQCIIMAERRLGECRMTYWLSSLFSTCIANKRANRKSKE